MHPRNFNPPRRCRVTIAIDHMVGNSQRTSYFVADKLPDGTGIIDAETLARLTFGEAVVKIANGENQ